jgi:hypothetical protein
MGRWRKPGYRAAGRRLAAAAGAAALLLSVAAAHAPQGAGQRGRPGQAAAAASPAAPALAVGDRPAGFWYGTDSWPMPVRGPAPYKEPVIGGAYGGYIGMTGNWATWLGCGDKVAWSSTNSRQANNNHTWHHLGIGTGVYWFMGGPGVDPHYNGTAAEARAWGQQQAARTLFDISHVHVIYPVVFADVELPGNAPGISPAPDNGWNSVYTSPCSGRVRSTYIAPSVDRAELNGFFSYLTGHSSYTPGVYSAPPAWSSIFGTGSASSIPNVDEWTYTANSSSLAHHPSGWCLSGTTTCAHFFGGVSRSSPHALIWQWSGGGGSANGYGDFDQIDGNRTP